MFGESYQVHNYMVFAKLMFLLGYLASLTSCGYFFKSFIILYNEPSNAQLFHKLSNCYMFRHYLVILRELVISTLPSYTSISNAAVGNTVYNLIEIIEVKQAKIYNSYKNTKLKLLTTNAAIWFNKICQTKQLTPKYTSIKFNQIHLNCKLYCQQLHLKYWCNVARY